ncbi:MAG TPA: aminoacyl-tRNA hydrolase [Candidatus Dojkabacteria bacterium]
MDETIRVKQVIVIRKDLKMPKGKLAAQVAHASLGAFLSKGHRNIVSEMVIPLDETNKPWLDKEFTKICLAVNSEEELLKIYKIVKANLSGIPHALIKDAGHTIFKEPTLTCLGIGPWYSEVIDSFTRQLKLYR